jgi:Flp pilus assembly protein TadG
MVAKNSWRATRRFGAAEDGAVAIEFAFVISILIVLLLGAYECTRYILVNLKADRTSSTVADLIAQSDGMTVAILNDVYSAAIGQMQPYDQTNNGRVIVTSIYRPDSTTTNGTVVWQCQGGGSYTTGVTSHIGTKGNPPTLPSGFTVDIGENIIVAEVFYHYTPSLFPSLKNIGGYQFDMFQPTTFYHITYDRPRGSLFTIDPGC